MTVHFSKEGFDKALAQGGLRVMTGEEEAKVYGAQSAPKSNTPQNAGRREVPAGRRLCY